MKLVINPKHYLGRLRDGQHTAHGSDSALKAKISDPQRAFLLKIN